MARKSVRRKKAAPAAQEERAARKQVVTFRLSEAEPTLIRKAADREPVARYSRRAVLAAAEASAKSRK